MANTYLSYNSIVSTLGFDSEAVINAIVAEKSGLALIDDKSIFNHPICASVIDKSQLQRASNALNLNADFTKLEQMMILALNKVIIDSNIEINEKVGLIISTTKGNIDLLDADSKFPKKRIYLSELGSVIKTHFGFRDDAIIVSNACVSGVMAISVANRYIKQGIYDHILIVGGDLVSKFVLSGFNSFHALSNLPCKPYSINRSGINIGEVGAAVLVTSNNKNLAPETVELIGDATSNDANHISGPSRSGEGLYRSISRAMKEASIKPEDIDFISAHGTATPFNDDMEAIALNRAKLQDVPLNSLKGYFGHTLGASGLLETIIGLHSLHRNTLFASAGFDILGVSESLNIIKKTTPKDLNIFLKTASGFGGCNTAALFKKVT